MIGFGLTNRQVQDLAEVLDDPASSDRTKSKLLVIRLHLEGARHGFIAKVLNLHANSVTNYLKEYLKGGLSAVEENKYYRPSSFLEPFMGLPDLCFPCRSGRRRRTSRSPHPEAQGSRQRRAQGVLRGRRPLRVGLLSRDGLVPHR